MGVYSAPLRSDEIMHFGVLGMRWGVRRYQNADGTLTTAGRKRYGVKGKKMTEAEKEKIKKRAKIAGGVAIGAAVIGSQANNIKKAVSNDALYEPSIKRGKGKEDAAPVEIMSQNTTKSISEMSKSLRTISDLNKKTEALRNEEKIDRKIKSMSDEELRRAVNRIQLEKQYKTLTTKDVRTGIDKTADILDIVGGLSATAASVATIAVMVRRLKGR